MFHRRVLAIPTIGGAVIGPCKETERKRGEVIEVIRFIDMVDDNIIDLCRAGRLNQKPLPPLYYVHRFYDALSHNSGRHIASNQVSFFNYAMEPWTMGSTGQRA